MIPTIRTQCFWMQELDVNDFHQAMHWMLLQAVAAHWSFFANVILCQSKAGWNYRGGKTISDNRHRHGAHWHAPSNLEEKIFIWSRTAESNLVPRHRIHVGSWIFVDGSNFSHNCSNLLPWLWFRYVIELRKLIRPPKNIWRCSIIKRTISHDEFPGFQLNPRSNQWLQLQTRSKLP